MKRDSKSSDLTRIVRFFDDYFRVVELPADPAFSRFLPMVYDPIGIPWRDLFEPHFHPPLQWTELAAST